MPATADGRGKRQFPRAILVLLLLTGNLTGARAQAPVPAAPYLLGAQAQGSFIVAHTPAVQHLAVSHPTGFELSLQRQTTGTAPWHAWYRYPKVGLALVYYDYHNPVLGRSYAASVYLNKTLWRTPRQEARLRLSTGLAYFTRPYDRATNHKNTIIGSPLSATLQARAEYDVALSEHLGLLLGLGLNHYSNGATSKPNFGINLPTLSLGLNYYQQRQFRPQPLPPNTRPADLGRNFLTISTSYGIKQVSQTDRNKYAVYSLMLAAGRRVSRKSNLLLGLEGFNDRSLAAQLRDTARAGAPRPDVKKAGVYVGHELLFGRLAFGTHLGLYVYNPYKSNKFYYERLALKYHFTDCLFGEVALKAHRTAADVIEFRVGMKW